MKNRNSKNSKMSYTELTRNLNYYVRNQAIAPAASEMTQGILWAVQTGRLATDADWAIRHMNAWQFAQLIGIVADNCETMNDVPRWLNANILTIEAIS